MSLNSSKKKYVTAKTSLFKGVNIDLSEILISQLVKIHGVSTFCLCPGGRNAPLVSVVSQAKGLKVFSFFEERSAGFFALGRCRRDKAPSAIITTSGTAVAELLPAVIEAYYSRLPLALITADRPSSYRGTGAPQSIEQLGIFSHYVEKTWDLEKTRKFDLSSWRKIAPCHINICFDEPLMDKEIKPLVFPPSSFVKSASLRQEDNSSTSRILHSEEPGSSKRSSLLTKRQALETFFAKVKKPLCIVAELPENIKTDLEQILSVFSWPVYAEALSGLRESHKLKPFILKSGEKFLSWLVLNKKIDSVLRIGKAPSARFWKDLEKTYSNIPVLSVSDQHWPGLGRAHPVVSFSDFFEWSGKLNKTKLCPAPSALSALSATSAFSPDFVRDIFETDKKQSDLLNKLLKKHPLSEPALIQQFSQKIPERSLLFLGNSLPIREWNLAGDYNCDKKLKYISNRGANGIDGLISSFLGVSEPGRQNWCLIGDLSCLYDLSAPWILRQMDPALEIFLLVINNGGGQIFSSLFSDPIFLNSHNLRFKKWAEMWSFNYYGIDKWPKVFSFSSPAVIELKINPSYTNSFIREYNRLFSKKTD